MQHILQCEAKMSGEHDAKDCASWYSTIVDLDHMPNPICKTNLFLIGLLCCLYERMALSHNICTIHQQLSNALSPRKKKLVKIK